MEQINIEYIDFIINENIMHEIELKNLFNKEVRKSLIGKKITIKDITKEGKYISIIDNQKIIISKKSINPIITKKEWLRKESNQLLLNILYNEERLNLIDEKEINEKILFVLKWYNIIEEGNFIGYKYKLSKKAYKSGINGIKEKIFSYLKYQKIEFNRNNRKLYENKEIEFLHYLANKYRYKLVKK